MMGRVRPASPELLGVTAQSSSGTSVTQLSCAVPPAQTALQPRVAARHHL